MLFHCKRWVFTILIFCTLFLTSSLDTRSELRFSLEKKQFEELKSFFPPAFDERFDLYVEAFNGKDFLFEKKGFKFRLKNSKKKTVIQVTKIFEKKYFQCGNKTFTWKKNKVFESQNTELIRLLLFKAFEMFKYLQSNQIIPLYLALDFDLQIRSLEFEGKHELFSSIQNEGSVIFIPSHTNKKVRLKRRVPLKSGKKLKFILGKTIEQGPEKDLETTYEIEAEGENVDLEKEKDSLDVFCKVLGRVKTPKESDEDESKLGEKELNLGRYIKKMPSFIFKKREKK
ncbi:MAG: hypothetical protein CME68_10355 [Halobacteriovoraceae bacterium]|nr:hypothetical protein [Halobacteriovoraceae bacterium]